MQGNPVWKHLKPELKKKRLPSMLWLFGFGRKQRVKTFLFPAMEYTCGQKVRLRERVDMKSQLFHIKLLQLLGNHPRGIPDDCA